ncbi:MAG: RagB/SusD family nutrient uptake outer membrane protein [Chitinophagaceae bacterium]
MKRRIYTIPIVLSLCLLNLSCKKNWLEAKPQKALVVPKKISDYQALLDNTLTSNSIGFNDAYNTLGEIGAGDFYVLDTFLKLRPFEEKVYKWIPDIYADQTNLTEWSNPYKRIFYTNVVLEGIDQIIPSNGNEQIAWHQVKGTAFFFRAVYHYTVAQSYCKPYQAGGSNADLGIPLRLTSNFNEPTTRSKVQETYQQIVTDLKQAASLLPVDKPTDTLYRLRPTKVAATGMLARVYLSMGEYDSAFVYADKSLQTYSTLLDYNSTTTGSPTGTQINIAPTTTASFARFNVEVIFHLTGSSWTYFLQSRLYVDSLLYKSYNVNDNRRLAFFKVPSGTPLPNTYTFRGSYDNSNQILFTGISTNELYLTRAECYARKGNIASAVNDLVYLLTRRYKPNTLGQILPPTADDALKLILGERRKELCFRSIRWSDLRRLNLEPQFQVTLQRVTSGQTYTLPPNSNLYVLPIPPDIIQLTSIQQNPR